VELAAGLAQVSAGSASTERAVGHLTACAAAVQNAVKRTDPAPVLAEARGVRALFDKSRARMTTIYTHVRFHKRKILGFLQERRVVSEGG
jgi:hypothetical protein